MEIAAFLIAFAIGLAAVWIGWGRIPIAWRRPRRRGSGPDPGMSGR